ncbi:MAG: glycerophosphodiester phosphodiesterase [Acidimicrobiales bacterium]
MAGGSPTGEGARYPFLDRPAPVAIAHRGGALEAPENTWASFSHAVELGYRYIETDVHATADGVVAVIHDPGIDRVSDRRGTVADLQWREVSQARVAGNETIPRLDELLAAWPQIRWNIDAKHEQVVAPLTEVIQRTNAIDRVCVTSFSDRRIARLKRALGPSLCTGMGPRTIARLRGSSWLPAAAPSGMRWRDIGVTQVPLSYGRLTVVDRRFVAGAHRLGLAVHVWTIDAEGPMDRLLDLGVDGIMTDRPTVLREVLRRRGEWDP